jgi:two-component system CheB/CheR fusion protein
VNNAVKHGGGKNIEIRLSADDGSVTLCIRDDGKGLPPDVNNSSGMGLHIMNYRAKMIGGTLEIKPCSERGTLVSCKLQS